MKKLLILVAAVALILSALVIWYTARFSTDAIINDVAPNTERTLTSGVVMGFADNGTHAWLGMPYAQPPTGALRWKAPRPIEPWLVPKAAVEYANKCPQAGLGGTGAVEGDEDCLYLNVWAPTLTNSPKPVMVFIHGGGNHIGESSTPIYRGTRFVRDHDVIMVSINYRLGPLGWLRHAALRDQNTDLDYASLDDSGNFATLDIVQALRWVQDNINVFGGDPNNVTIFGESAGGFNVLSLMVSPLASGLYHKAIVQSGGLTLVTPSEAENFVDDAQPGQAMSANELVNQLLINAGRATDRASAKAAQQDLSHSQLREFLYSLNAEQLLQGQRRNIEATQDSNAPKAFVLGAGQPQVTPYIFGDGVVLPADAQIDTLFANPKTYNVTPVILGSNRDETKLFQAFVPGYTKRVFGFPYQLSKAEQYQRDAEYGSNMWKARAVDELAIRLQASQGDSVYAYRFDWDELRSVLLLDLSTLIGAGHALELPFVFGNFDLVNKTLLFKDSSARTHLSRNMMSYWAEFAHSGNPTQGRDNDLPAWTSWPADTGSNINRVMLLDTEQGGGLRMDPTLVTTESIAQDLAADQRFTDPQRCEFAAHLFPNPMPQLAALCPTPHTQ